MRVTLALLQVTGIQEYIFGANNLRSSVGASELIARATTEWIVKALNAPQDPKLTHNATWNPNELRLDYAKTLHIGELDAEVIYAGGGNGLILFQGEKEHFAIPFVHAWTRDLLEYARGLNIVVGHRSFEWRDATDRTSLAREHQALRKEVNAQKLACRPDVPLPGLGVNLACAFTGLPSTNFYKFTKEDANPPPVSTSALEKLCAYKIANERLEKLAPRVQEKGFEFVYDFDQFGEKDESSYVAIVHTDGNAMGKRFEAIANACARSEQDEMYVEHLREFSESIESCSTRALRETVDLLLDLVDDENKIAGVVPIQSDIKKRKGKANEEAKPRFPFRPIVFGGDDTTFVCEGRLGLTAAQFYLTRLAAGNLVDKPEAKAWGGPLYARGGVAVVKSHFPFARAYALAVDLTRSAKMKLKEWEKAEQIKKTEMALDWHFSTSGIVLGLDEIRAREYVVDNGNSLLMRPLLLPDADTKLSSSFWRTWGTFASVMQEFESDWKDRRNKVKALRDALRQGPEGVRRFLTQYNEAGLPEIRGQSAMSRDGWDGVDCGYFDAIEALDFWVPLKRKEQSQ